MNLTIFLTTVFSLMVYESARWAIRQWVETDLEKYIGMLTVLRTKYNYIVCKNGLPCISIESGPFEGAFLYFDKKGKLIYQLK